jgi:hypothetical protein
LPGPDHIIPIIQSARNGTLIIMDKNSLAGCIIAPLAQNNSIFIAVYKTKQNKK